LARRSGAALVPAMRVAVDPRDALMSGDRTAAAGAQQSAMPVIGLLHPASLDGLEHHIAAFRQGLKEDNGPLGDKCSKQGKPSQANRDPKKPGRSFGQFLRHQRISRRVTQARIYGRSVRAVSCY